MDLTAILAPLKTDRERIYVHARLRGMSEHAAYKAAGGKGNPQPATWIYEPHVVSVLAAAQNISAEETGMTREKIRDMLVNAYHNATTAAEQIMAARELAKLFGLFAPTKVQVAHDHRHSIEDKRANIKDMSTTELESLLAIDGEFAEIKPPAQLSHD